jgi:hypothetical protein
MTEPPQSCAPSGRGCAMPKPRPIDTPSDDGWHIHATTDGVLLTVSPDALHVCTECPDLHVRLSRSTTGATLRGIAAAFLHLAEHVDGDH